MRHILLTKGLLQAHSERVYQGTVLTCVPQTTQISWLFHETVGSSVLEETIFSMAIYITVLSSELHGPVQQGILGQVVGATRTKRFHHRLRLL